MVRIAPVDPKPICQPHTPYEFPDASSIPIPKGVDDVQFRHHMGEVLNLALLLALLQHPFLVDLMKDPTKFPVDQIRWKK